MDHKILMAALNTLGLNPRLQGDSIYFVNGVYSINEKSLEFRGTSVEERTAELKRAYSGEVVKFTAKKYGWQLKQTEPLKFQVMKRSF